MTQSHITKEDQARNPQAVLDVLEFYTDIQKREYDNFGVPVGPARNNSPMPGGSTAAVAADPTSRIATPPARFEAGLGLAGQMSSQKPPSSLPRSDTAPPGTQMYHPVPMRQEPQHYPPTGPGMHHAAPPPRRQGEQQSAPTRHIAEQPRPLVAERRAPAPPKPPTNGAVQESRYALRDVQDARLDAAPRPPIQTAKTSPATPFPAAANNNAPNVANAQSATSTRPLQPQKKPQGPPPAPSAGAATSNDVKPSKASEKRVSAMSEPQIMDKLRSVVSTADPSTLYAKIKKVGQG